MPIELWDRCNAIIEGQKGAHKRPARRVVQLFAGLTYCHCGAKMYVPANTPKYVCYKCRNKIPIEDLEAVYVNELKGVFLSRTRLEAELKRSNEAISQKEELLKVRLAEREKNQQEIDRAYRLYLDKKLDGDRFTALYNPLYERKKQLEDEIPKLQAELDVLKINGVSADEVLSEASDLYSHWPKFERESECKSALSPRAFLFSQFRKGGLALSPHIPWTPDDTAVMGRRMIVTTTETVKYAG